ncbi:hypothetical protein ALC56_08870, partial [Trachymyrmex septentrionalis]
KVQPTTGTTSSPRRRGRKKQCSPLTRKKRGPFMCEASTRACPDIYVHTMLRYAHASEMELHLRGLQVCSRSDSPAGWLVRPLWWDEEEGQWMVGD